MKKYQMPNINIVELLSGNIMQTQVGSDAINGQPDPFGGSSAPKVQHGV